jgi:hypothetical protein
MTTYERWMKKFNEGGHESFEEFICNELDEVLYGLDPLDAPVELTVDEPVPPVTVGDETVPPTDPNAGGSSNL